MRQPFLELNNRKHKKIDELVKKIMKPFDKYQPTVVGTYPINIDIQGSDIDIVLCVEDENAYLDELNCFENMKSFSIEVKDVILCRFIYEGYEFELYASKVPINKLNSYRHLMIEKRLLNLFGNDFKAEIIELKQKGLKTEAAFCTLLGLYGNSYDALLTLESMTDQTIMENGWINELKLLKDYAQMHFEYFTKGWSQDIKIITYVNDNKYLIRQSDSKYTFKSSIFDHMKELSVSINVSKPVEFYQNKTNIELYEWLEGCDLEDVLLSFPKEQQYKLGVEAGNIQRSIHQIEGTSFDWYKQYLKKIDRVIKLYKECGIKMPNDEKVIDFIQSNKHLLKDRPIVFQHGDYHIGNMLYTPDGGIGIIDFNRASEGDPWEEYDRFVFTYGVSPHFALGQLHGYFGKIPDVFFKVVSVYSALNALAAIPWAIPFGEKDIEVMKRNYLNIYETYKGFETTIPLWYSKCLEEENSWVLKV